MVAALALALAYSALGPADASAQTGCNLSDPDPRVVITGGTTVNPLDEVGDLVVVDGDVDVRGRVAGDVVAVEGDVRIAGCVGGDVTTFAGTTTLLPTARVGGDLIYSDERPVVAPQAQFDGEVRNEDWGDIGDAPWAIIGAAALWIAVSVSLLVSGVGLVAVFPRAADAAARAARSQTALTIALGLAAVIGLPLLAALAFVTLLGIPLAIVLGLALLPLACIGYLVCSVVIGRVVTSEGTHAVLAFLAGLGILRAIALIPVAGALAWVPAVIIGLGALVVTAMDDGEPAAKPTG